MMIFMILLGVFSPISKKSSFYHHLSPQPIPPHPLSSGDKDDRSSLLPAVVVLCLLRYFPALLPSQCRTAGLKTKILFNLVAFVLCIEVRSIFTIISLDLKCIMMIFIRRLEWSKRRWFYVIWLIKTETPSDWVSELSLQHLPSTNIQTSTQRLNYHRRLRRTA